MKNESRTIVRVAIATTLLVVLLASACAPAAPTPTATKLPEPTDTNPPAPTATPPPTPTPEPVGIVPKIWDGETLTIGMGAHPSSYALRDSGLIEEFEQLSGATIVLDELTDLYQKAKLEGSAEVSSYDILMIASHWLPEFADLGLLKELDGYIEDAAYTPLVFDYEDIMVPYRQIAEWEGKTYALTFSGETDLYFYRKDLFEEYGKVPPETWDEVLELARFFNEAKPGELYGIALRPFPAWMEIMWPMGGKWFDEDGNVIIKDVPANMESLAFMMELQKNVPPGGELFSYEQASDAFMTGMVATYFDSSNVSYLEDPEFSDVVGKIGYSLIPAGPAGRKTLLLGWSWVIPAPATHPELAWDFMMYAGTKDSDARRCLEGAMPLRASTFTDPDMVQQFPYYPIVVEALQYGNPDFFPRHPRWTAMLPALYEYLGGAVTGAISPEEGLPKFHDQVSELIREWKEGQ